MEPTKVKTATRRGRPTLEEAALRNETSGHPAEKEEHRTLGINKRFFTVLYEMIDSGRIQSLYAFCKDNHINRGNLYYMKQNMDRHRVPATYLSYLVDNGVNATWLLTGKGKPFE